MFKRILLTLALTGMSIPTVGMADDRLAGSYEGVIFSSGNDYPGLTHLFVSSDGVITGKYVFKGHYGPEVGVLGECHLSQMKLKCVWEDKYGAGDWVVEFLDDFQSFSGKWYARLEADVTIDLGYRWDGSKDAVGTSFSEGV